MCNLWSNLNHREHNCHHSLALQMMQTSNTQFGTSKNDTTNTKKVACYLSFRYKGPNFFPCVNKCCMSRNMSFHHTISCRSHFMDKFDRFRKSIQKVHQCNYLIPLQLQLQDRQVQIIRSWSLNLSVKRGRKKNSEVNVLTEFS